MRNVCVHVCVCVCWYVLNVWECEGVLMYVYSFKSVSLVFYVVNNENSIFSIILAVLRIFDHICVLMDNFGGDSIPAWF